MQHEAHCPVCGSEITDLPVTLLPERGMVVANGKFAQLTGREMALVQRLAEVFPRVLTTEAALEYMYQLSPDDPPEIKIIDVFICKARKKLNPIGVRIDTLWGKGYVLALEKKPAVIAEAS